MNISLDLGSTVFNMYWNVEAKCRKITKQMSYYVCINQVMMVVSLCFSIFHLLVGNFDTTTWILPFSNYVPFDTRVVYNWYLQWAYQFSISLVYASVISSLTAYFTSCCLYILGICDHFDLLIQSLQIDAEKNRIEENPMKYWKNSLKIKEKLCKLVEIHIEALEWVDQWMNKLQPNTIYIIADFQNIQFGSWHK